jgi:hypothetical protein
MIDRKTRWFLILLIAAMCAASFWRLSLAPDWTHVSFINDKGQSHTKNGLVLFIGPASLLLCLVLASVSRRLVSGSEEAIRAYQRANRLVLLGVGVLSGLMHVFMVSRSLGASLNLNGEILSRLVIGITAILVMMQGNRLPKLPWVTSRFKAFELDAWQSARLKRFSGRLSVAYGLALIVVAALVPTRAMGPLVMAIVPVYLGAIVWYCRRLKREKSLLPAGEKIGSGA